MPNQQLTRNSPLNAGSALRGEVSVLDHTFKCTSQLPAAPCGCDWKNSFVYSFMNKLMKGHGDDTITVLDLVLANCEAW